MRQRPGVPNGNTSKGVTAVVAGDWLVKYAVRHVGSFKYVVAAAAAVILATRVFGLSASPQINILLTVGLIMLAVIFIFLDFASRRIGAAVVPSYMDIIVAFFFWCVSLTFAVLLVFLLIWMWQFLFPPAIDSRTTDERRVDSISDAIYAYRGN